MNGDGGDNGQTGVPPDAPIKQWDRPLQHAPVWEETAPKHVVELRHDAGLTAGHTLHLRPGRFRLGPGQSSDGGLVTGAPETVSFELFIAEDGATTLSAGSEPVAVEGIMADRPVRLEHGDVIQLQTDHFVFQLLTPIPRRRPNSEVTPRPVAALSLPSMAGWLWFFAAVALFGLCLGFVRSSLFGLALIGLGGIIGTLFVRSHRRGLKRDEHATRLVNARSLFFKEIVDARKASADSLRSEANTPATVAHRASQPPTQAGPRLYATVASGDRSWQPPLSYHRDPGWPHQKVTDELSFLPAIPFTVDLDAGPIAVIGPRLATLAVARHIATTALVASPQDAGVLVSTAVPADWRWLPATNAPVLHIFDNTTGPLEPRTVVLASSRKALADVSAFTHVVQVHEDGQASIQQPNGEKGRGLAPHGITEEQARDIVQMISGADATIDLRRQQPAVDLRHPEHNVLDASRLLVTGPDRSQTKNVLASAALRQAARFPHRSIFILDRGDRALIRLSQLAACRRYVAIDQIAHVETMVGELETIQGQTPESRVLFLAPGLWEATAFYRNSGRVDLANRIDEIVARMEVLPIAASAIEVEDVPRSSFLVWVNTDGSDFTEVQVTQTDNPDAQDSLIIDLNALPGIDLTASVARLTTSLDEETPT